MVTEIEDAEAALDAAQARWSALFYSVALYPSPRQRYPVATDTQIEAIRTATFGVIAAFRRYEASRGIDAPCTYTLEAEIRALSTDGFREYMAVHGW